MRWFLNAHRNLSFNGGATQRRRHEAQRNWRIWNHPKWLTEQLYSEQIQPRLSTIEVKAIATALGVSITYASYIRAARRRPHPRHWQALAHLTGCLPCEAKIQ